MQRIALMAVLSILASCKTAERNQEQEGDAIIKYDGVYIAENPTASPSNSAGVPLEGKKSILVLRFYDRTSGVIIPETVESLEDLENDTLPAAYYKWAKEFEVKNPKDKDFINFRFRLTDDSIAFAQKSPEITYEYGGKSFNGDSMHLTLSFKTDYGKPGKGKLLKFRFYPLSN